MGLPGRCRDDYTLEADERGATDARQEMGRKRAC